MIDKFAPDDTVDNSHRATMYRAVAEGRAFVHRWGFGEYVVREIFTPSDEPTEGQHAETARLFEGVEGSETLTYLGGVSTTQAMENAAELEGMKV